MLTWKIWYRAEMNEELDAHQRSLGLLLGAVAPHLDKVVLARLSLALKGVERIAGPSSLYLILRDAPSLSTAHAFWCH